MSLDGPNAEVHDDFRGGIAGAFECVERAAALFNKHGIKFIINSSFTKRNQSYIMETFRKAESLGAHAWYMFLIVPTGRGEEIFKELVSKEDYEEILVKNAPIPLTKEMIIDILEGYDFSLGARPLLVKMRKYIVSHSL